MKVQNYPNYFFKLRNCQPSAGVLHRDVRDLFRQRGALSRRVRVARQGFPDHRADVWCSVEERTPVDGERPQSGAGSSHPRWPGPPHPECPRDCRRDQRERAVRTWAGGTAG